MSVTFDTGREGLPEDLRYREEPLEPSDRRVPAIIRATKSLHVVTSTGVETVTGLTKVSTSSTPLADWWYGIYGPTSASGLGIATVGPPPPGTTLQLAPKPEPTRWWLDPRVSQLLSAAPSTVAERVGGWLDQAHAEVQHLPGRFVAGATSIVAITIWPEPGEMCGGLLTLDKRGHVVQVLLPLLCDSAVTIDGLVDLDGDGTDEVIVTTSGIEDLDQTLLRLGDSGTKSYYLDGGGH